jgi:hypothetical protein
VRCVENNSNSNEFVFDNFGDTVYLATMPGFKFIHRQQFLYSQVIELNHSYSYKPENYDGGDKFNLMIIWKEEDETNNQSNVIVDYFLGVKPFHFNTAGSKEMLSDDVDNEPIGSHMITSNSLNSGDFSEIRVENGQNQSTYYELPINFHQIKNPGTLYVTYTDFNNRKFYKLYENLALNAPVDLVKSQFTEMSDDYSVEVPESDHLLFSCNGIYDKDISFNLFTSYGSTEQYLNFKYKKDVFSSFSIVSYSNLQDYTGFYMSRGKLPQKIEYPSFSYEVRNGSLTSFDATLQSDFDLCEVSWMANNYTESNSTQQILILGTKEDINQFVMPQLPADVISENPDLSNLEVFSDYYSIVGINYDFIDGYDNYINYLSNVVEKGFPDEFIANEAVAYRNIEKSFKSKHANNLPKDLLMRFK